MKIILAADHAGFALKEFLKKNLSESGYIVDDLSAEKLIDGDDYPDIMVKVGFAISENPEQKAIIIGGSGQGEAIVVNRFPGVRADVYYGGSLEIVKLSREHNDANILSLGARFMKDEEALEAVKLWLSTPFSEDERHIRRIEKIDQIA